MDKPTLLTAVDALLTNTHSRGSNYAYSQAARQFNSLLERAKSLYPTRPDIQCMESYEYTNIVNVLVFEDAAKRLKFALEIIPSSSAGQLLAQVRLPSDAPADA